MSELRRQVQAAADAIGEWEVPQNTGAARDLAEEMRAATSALWAIQRKAAGLSGVYGQRDPMTWVAPLGELVRQLDEAAAWWAETLAGDPPADWSQAAADRMSADLAVFAASLDNVLTELEFSARAEESKSTITARPTRVDQADLRPPTAERRHAADRPAYRRRRRWGLILAPATIGIGALAVIVVVGSAESGHHTGISAGAFTVPTKSGPGSTAAPPATTAASTSTRPAPRPAATTPASVPSSAAAPSPVSGSAPGMVIALTPTSGGRITAVISVQATTTAPTILYTTVYATSQAGERGAQTLSQRTLSGQLQYTVTLTLDPGEYCGAAEITVVATAEGSASASIAPGC